MARAGLLGRYKSGKRWDRGRPQGPTTSTNGKSGTRSGRVRERSCSVPMKVAINLTRCETGFSYQSLTVQQAARVDMLIRRDGQSAVVASAGISTSASTSLPWEQ